MISGRFEVLADEIRDKAVIVKVDCDENNETCQAQGIAVLPTFNFYRGHSFLHQIVGPNFEEVAQKT